MDTSPSAYSCPACVEAGSWTAISLISPELLSLKLKHVHFNRKMHHCRPKVFGNSGDRNSPRVRNSKCSYGLHLAAEAAFPSRVRFSLINFK